MDKLFKQLSELGSHEESKFEPLDPDEIKGFGEGAVLIELRVEEYWLPYSQLRYDDEQLYASKWNLEKKGIEV